MDEVEGASAGETEEEYGRLFNHTASLTILKGGQGYIITMETVLALFGIKRCPRALSNYLSTNIFPEREMEGWL